jgi:hypothetical protein
MICGPAARCGKSAPVEAVLTVPAGLRKSEAAKAPPVSKTATTRVLEAEDMALPLSLGKAAAMPRIARVRDAQVRLAILRQRRKRNVNLRQNGARLYPIRTSSTHHRGHRGSQRQTKMA